MSNNKYEIKNPSSNRSPDLEVGKMGSANLTVASEHFWVGVKLPKNLVFGLLGYIAGGVTGIYGGEIRVLLVGVLGVIFYLFDLLRGSV